MQYLVCTAHLLTLGIIKVLTAPVVPNLKQRQRLYNILILPLKTKPTLELVEKDDKLLVLNGFRAKLFI